MTAFAVIGSLAAIAGIVAVVLAIRQRGDGEDPKNNAMLIGGTMLAAFGIVIAGFSIAYQRATPLALNAAAPTP